MVKLDYDKSGLISCPQVLKILHKQDCFISREELIWLFQKFGKATLDTQPDLSIFEEIFFNENAYLQYKLMTKELGLN